MTDLHIPTIAALEQAHARFRQLEPHDYFYESALLLVNTTYNDADNTRLVNGLMTFVRFWNTNFYRFFRYRNPSITLVDHFRDLDAAITKCRPVISQFRGRELNSYGVDDEAIVKDVFDAFKDVLGRVGAAKCLHLLAPRFLPLWDAPILQGYRMENKPYHRATDAERYAAFMHIVKAQLAAVGDISFIHPVPLKALDEYNYFRFSRVQDKKKP